LVKSDTGVRGLNVIDLGVGMAAALVTKFLREGGAEITRLEPPAGDPFYGVPLTRYGDEGLRSFGIATARRTDLRRCSRLPMCAS
jgi:crotonobetainyl-CoA:carnitine CoA-transferase CaiB-like acyl-CoA transferase